MKARIVTTMVMVVALLAGGGVVHAEDRGVNGLLLGAGSGALIGQAIGRNTGATLLGTAVGSVLGYIIGNEMDKGGYVAQPVRVASGPAQPVPEFSDWRHERPRSNAPRMYVEKRMIAPLAQCREAEVLGTINGRPRTIRTTVCRERDGRWVTQQQGRPLIVERTTVYRGVRVPDRFRCPDDDHRHRERTSLLYRPSRW